MSYVRALAFVLSCLVLSSTPRAAAQSPTTLAAKPVPLMQAEPLPHHEVRFLRGDRELARYHFNPADRRPFLFPINGPSGHSLTRMGHPHDPVGHSHHNSVWISHHVVNGINFWGDAGPNLGRIVPQRIEQLDDTDEAARLTALNHWINEKTGELLLVERRRIEVRPLPSDETLTVIDLEFAADKQPVVLEKSAFGFIGVRMRKTIGVHDGGGWIRNSEGAVNEKGADGTNGVHWKPARWCDYSGPVAEGAEGGITLFDHPSNFNHPTVFHVRDDGWMGASLTFDGPFSLEPGKKLKLRYGLYAHAESELATSAIEARWQAFTKLDVPPTLEKAKPQSK